MKRGLLFGVALSSLGCSLTDLSGLRGNPDATIDGAGALCSGNHILCETFDDGGWAASWIMQSNQSTMDVVTDDFVSPPGSLRITAGVSDAHGILLGTFPSPVTDFVCSVSVRVAGFPDGYYSRVSPVVLYDINDPSLEDYEITFMGYNQNGYLDEHVESAGDAGWIDDSQTLPYTVVDGAWHRLTLTVHLGAPPTAEIHLDGNSGVGATKPLTPPASVSGVAFAIGISSSGSGGGWVAHFDDAVCDAL